MAGIVCPQCNAVNKENTRFCAECGAELGSARSSRPVPQPVSGPTTIKPLPSPIDEPPAEEARALQNRYRIEEQLGRGGFGAVYRAWDLNLSRLCAVKENLAITPEAQRQFTREATLLANLSHPNLPRVIDHFIIPGQGQYLVMDFVEGDDLCSILAQQEIVPVDQAVEWVTQVCGALEYLHNQTPPVLHRDIKPANIRVTPKGRAVLVDFGLVKVYDQSLKTTIGARAITPGFAPPEQYGQGKTDERTDLYALGATLYTLVTGIEPPESVARMAGQNLESAHQLNPQVPLVVSDVIERSMALEPGMRFQTAGEFRAALKTAQTISVQATPAKNPETILVAPEANFQTTLMPAVSAPVADSASVSQSTNIAMPASKPASAPLPPAAPVFVPPQPVAVKPKPKRTGLVIGLGGLVVLAICLGGAALLASLFSGEGMSSENATQTYVASLNKSVQMTTTSLAAQVASTSSVQATHTPGRTPTVTAAVIQNSPTAKFNSAATAEPKTAATQQALKGILANMEANAGLIFAPKDGRIPHKAENKKIETISASVGLRSFILEVTFYVPYPTSESAWDFGLIFRQSSPNVEYNLVFNSDKSWKYYLLSGLPGGKVVLEGKIEGLNIEEGAANKIRLYADKDRGWLFVNDQFISELDLSKQYSGAIMIGIGFHGSAELTGKLTDYKDFTVWSLP